MPYIFCSPYKLTFILLIALSIVQTTTAHSGAFIGSYKHAKPLLITHPLGYDGSTKTLYISVGHSSGFLFSEDMQTSIKNIIATWNEQQPSSYNLINGESEGMAFTDMDLESTLLHEMGHCLGLDHPNIGDKSQINPTSNATLTLKGSNHYFNLLSNNDQVDGSPDDNRGNDTNLHWFNQYNNPFMMPDSSDVRSLYINKAYLPNNDIFIANGSREFALLLGLINTEVVMQQQAFPQEIQRQLSADDIYTLQLAQAGFDRIHNTEDDYRIQLYYVGETDEADILLQPSLDNLASCRVGFNIHPQNANHAIIVSSDIYINIQQSWHFNLALNNQPPTLSPTPAYELLISKQQPTKTFHLAASDPDGDDTLIFWRLQDSDQAGVITDINADGNELRFTYTANNDAHETTEIRWTTYDQAGQATDTTMELSIQENHPPYISTSNLSGDIENGFNAYIHSGLSALIHLIDPEGGQQFEWHVTQPPKFGEFNLSGSEANYSINYSPNNNTQEMDDEVIYQITDINGDSTRFTLHFYTQTNSTELPDSDNNATSSNNNGEKSHGGLASLLLGFILLLRLQHHPIGFLLKRKHQK